MPLENDLGEVIDKIGNPQSLFDESLSVLKDTIFQEYEDEDVKSYLKKLLWNEIEELPVNNFEDFILASICLYHLEEVHIVDIRVLLDKYYKDNILNDLGYVEFALLTLIKQHELPNDIISFFQFHMKDYGVNHFDLTSCLKIAENLGQDVSEYDLINSKYDSFTSRPEYTKEIIENTDIDDLEILQYWVAPDIKKQIVNELVSRKLKGIEVRNYEDAKEQFEQNSFLQDFSLSYNVLDDRLPNLEPRSIDMNELGDLPDELSREWLPKFVYSKPELEENIRIYFPGGRHIGHSAILIKSNFGSFMMDYGLSVVNTSKSRWLPQIEKLDFMLISHAHMDHSGSLPIFYGKERKVPWFGLRETKIMTEMLWADTKKLTERYVSPEVVERNRYLKRLTSRGGIINTLDNFNQIEIEKKYQLTPSIKVKPYDASHLFGSVGFEITIGGKRILYTGDFNGDKGVNFPTDCDITLFDSTYFERYQDYPPPEQGLQSALDNSDRILIPAFSMGRSQELIFKLKQLEAEKDWKIYLTGMGGRLASKLNLSVGSSRGIQKGGVEIAPTVDPEDFGSKTIVIGGQGMLQAGTSRRLFDHTMDDPDTSVILCGYQAPNTLGYHLLNQDEYLLGKYKQNVKRIKMSGHTSGETLDTFMDNLSGQKVMVHAPEGAYANRNRKDIEQPPNKGHINI